MLLAIVPILLIVSGLATEAAEIRSNQERAEEFALDIKAVLGKLISAYDETWGKAVFDLKDSLYTTTEQYLIIQAVDLTSAEFFKEYDSLLTVFMAEAKVKVDTVVTFLSLKGDNPEISKVERTWTSNIHKHIKDSFDSFSQSFNTYKATVAGIFDNKGDDTSFATRKHNAITTIEKEGITKFNVLLKQIIDSTKNIVNHIAKSYALETPKEDLQFQLSAVVTPEREIIPIRTQQDVLNSVIDEIDELVQTEQRAVFEAEKQAIADTRSLLKIARDKNDVQILLLRKIVGDGNLFAEVEAGFNRLRTGLSDTLSKGERRMHEFAGDDEPTHKDDVDALISDWDVVIVEDGKAVKANWTAAQSDYYANVTAAFNDFKNSHDSLALSTSTDSFTDTLHETVRSSLADFISNLIRLTNNVKDHFKDIYTPPVDEEPTILTKKEIVARTISDINKYMKDTEIEVEADLQELLLSLKDLLVRARLRHYPELILSVLEDGEEYHFRKLDAAVVNFLEKIWQKFEKGINDIHGHDEDEHKVAVHKVIERWGRVLMKIAIAADDNFHKYVDAYMQNIRDNFAAYDKVDGDDYLSYDQLVKRTDKYHDQFMKNGTVDFVALVKDLEDATQYAESRFENIFDNGDEVNTDGSIGDIKSNAVTALENARDDGLTDLLQSMNDKHDDISNLLRTAIDKDDVMILLRATRNGNGSIYVKIALEAIGIAYELERIMTSYLTAIDEKFKTKYYAELNALYKKWYYTVNPALASLTAERKAKQIAYSKQMTDLFNGNLSKDDLRDQAGSITDDFIAALNDYADKFIPAYKTLLTNFINSFKELLGKITDSDAT